MKKQANNRHLKRQKKENMNRQINGQINRQQTNK